MLITNFAAGELSKTLFGRTDLPQYYRGAARMENFDVIPTGGVKRRSGTEHLLKLDKGDGRIIPFIVNRDLGFLLYLTPWEITVYKLVEGVLSDAPTQTFDSNYMLDEINEVQYAQNFDTMVLVHENHAPLEVKLKNEKLEITTLVVDNNVKIKPTSATEDEIKQKYPDGKKDERYAEGKFLRGEGNYPRGVTFYNGRLIFAGTKNDPQRLFVSKVMDDDAKMRGIYPFATYDFFATKQRKYVSVLGEIDPDDTSKLILYNIYEMFKFTDSELWNYRVDSPFFSKEARIRKLYGDILQLTEQGKTILPLTSAENAALEAKKNAFLNYNQQPETDAFTDYIAKYTMYHKKNAPTQGPSYGLITLEVGVSEYYITPDIHSIYPNSSSDITRFLRGDIAKEQNLFDYLYNLFISAINEKYNQMKAYSMTSGFIDTIDDPVINTVKLTDEVNELCRRIQETMKYDFRLNTDYGKTYYGKPIDIHTELILKYGSAGMYVTFYTEEYLEDEYPTPDCGFTFEIASDANDAIRWLAVNKGLIAGTETGEWIIPPDVHATNIHATLNSRYGSDRIQGTAVGDATCFFQTGKKSLAEYYIPQQDNNFRVNNMAMLVPEMLSESPATEFDYVSSPHAKLLITRADGAMATLLYERGTGTFAWTRITTGPERVNKIDRWRKKRLEVTGQIKSVAVLPGPDGNDDAYLVVKRNNDYYLEKLQEDGGVYLDCYMKVENSDPWALARALYGNEGVGACRIYTDEDGVLKHEALDADAEPDRTKAGDFYIGYLYTSVLRTMPVLANDQMKKQRIVNLAFRFLESYLPNITSIDGGGAGKTDVPGGKVPYNGIFEQTFPGTWDKDVQAELSTDEPAPVTILALNAEMGGAQ